MTSPAAEAARDEAELWATLIDVVPEGWDDVPATEAAAVGFFDPGEDLAKRAARWSHTLPSQDLGSLAAFAAGLAVAEAEAWDRDEPHIATRAYEDRRFLVGDRIIHWAVPWLDAVAENRPDLRDVMLDHRTVLLEIGDRLRPAPALAASEGTVLEGHDAFGPLDPPGPIGTVRTGLVLVGGQRAIEDRAGLADLHESAAARWRGLAWTHPGTERLWSDLATRAERAAADLRAAR
jgi:hypothetical protein